MTDRADVGEGEGAPGEVRGAELTRRAQTLQPVELMGDVQHTQRLHVLHVRHQQPLSRVHGQADVVSRLQQRHTTTRHVYRLLHNEHNVIF